MAYSFRPGEETVGEGLRRVAASQLRTGLDELRHDELSRAEKVHQARKRCKKLRGLLRLVRKSFDGYSAENRAFRDAARMLSCVRDTAAVLESLDALEARYSGELKKAALAPLRKALDESHAEVDADEVEERLSDMRLVFRDALDRVETWSLDGQGADAFSKGAAKTFGRARKAMARAARSHAPEDIHEWRKRVKYHWYHTRLLRRIWLPVMTGYAGEASGLSDDLGDHRDLAILSDRAAQLLGRKTETAELVAGLAASRQAELERACFTRGRKLLADPPDVLAKRWAAWWQAASGS